MITQGNYLLIYSATGLPAGLNDAVLLNGEAGWHISGGEAPRNTASPGATSAPSASTGRVWIENAVTGQTRIFFPNVIGCSWILVEPRTEDRRKA